LHSIVIDEVLKIKDEKYDIYFDKNSILYFDNEYPPLATKTNKINNIINYCKQLNNILLEIKKYFKMH